MALTIKNYKLFQQYKHRFPPWIKLHRKLLIDQEYHSLDPAAAKYLSLIWLCGDEKGVLPALPQLAFELRIPVEQLEAHLKHLGHWLIEDNTQDAHKTKAKRKQSASTTPTEGNQDDSKVLSQSRVKELKSRVKEESKDSHVSLPKKTQGHVTVEIQTLFDIFWANFPTRRGKKRGKHRAMTKFLELTLEEQSQCAIAAKNFSKSEMAQESIGIMDPHRFIWSTLNQEAEWKNWIAPEEEVIPKLKPSKFENSSDANVRTLHSVLDQLKPNKEDEHGAELRQISEGGEVIDLPSPDAGICDPRTTA